MGAYIILINLGSTKVQVFRWHRQAMPDYEFQI